MHNLTETVETRIFPEDDAFMDCVLLMYPNEYPNKSAIIRAALQVFRRWIRERGEKNEQRTT